MAGVVEINFLTLVTAAAVFFLSLFLYKNRYSKASKFIRQLPGPPKLPIFGNSLDLNLSNEGITKRVQFEWPKLYGPRYVISVGLRHYFVSFKCGDVEKLLSSSVHLEKGSEYNFIVPWLGEGLLLSSGSKWMKRRKMLTPTFHFKILEDFMQVFNDQSMVMVDILKEQAKGGKPVEICHAITNCALDIICETAMGKKINAQHEKSSPYVNAIYSVSALLQYRSLRPWLHPDLIWRLSPPGRKESKELEILHGFTDKVISEKKAELLLSKNSGKKNDEKTEKESGDLYMSKNKKILAFLDLLLGMQLEDPDSISDLDIRAETDTFMFEGHDTTAAGLSWTIFLLGCNPEHQEKVREELRSIFGEDNERKVTSQDLTQMKYLECCIKESLRLYPSVPFIARKLKSELKLEDSLVIPENFNFAVFPMQIHRNPEIYPDPEEFRPERFFPENSAKRHPYAYVPFSAGPRNCIGQKFAMMEEKVILANFFRNFKAQSLERREDVVLMTEIILRPKDGLQMGLEWSPL